MPLQFALENILPMFSSRSFMVPCFIFNSFNHFEFNFVYGARVSSDFIHFHVTVQPSQHHLPKRLSLFHCIFLPPLSKLDGRCVGLFLGSLFCSIDPYDCFVPISRCFDYCTLTVFSEVWEGYASCVILFPQDCFSNFWSFYGSQILGLETNLI